MAVQQPPLPRCWIRVDELTPGPFSPQRTDSRGTWLPPRSRGWNVKNPFWSNRWFRFQDWQTLQITPPTDINYLKVYKCCSMYYINGIFWIYPDDASTNQVGDGTQTPTSNIIEENSSDAESDEDSDEDSDEGHLRWEDWTPLKFKWPDNQTISYATRRSPYPTVHYRGSDNAKLRELLPDHYFASAQQAPDGLGGFSGHLSTLIGLIVLSVRPQYLAQAMPRCLGQTYQPHHRTPGEGRFNMRGVVVTIYHETYPRSPDLAKQLLRYFEEGRYGSFTA